MNNEIPTIHDFDINLICEYFSNLERQGPGSPEVTLRALSFVDNLTPHSHIADVGCGTGGQTRMLAQHAPGQITGIDLFPHFIELFTQKAQASNLSHRVKGVVGNMENLPFEEGSLDLIWSEGAIYNIGFDRGINEWRKFLKPGGYLSITEAAWFTENRPAAIEQFWNAAYPEIDTIANKVLQLQKAGYVPVATFILPENCWLEHFYALQSKIQEPFLQKHAGNRAAENFVASERYEALLYQKYKAYYGYAFFIARKL